MRRNDQLLETEKLDDLFSLLKEMTQPGISHLKFAPNVGPALMWSLIGLSWPFLFSSILVPARWQHLGMTPSELHDALLNVERLFLAIFLGSLTIFILALLYIVWHHKQFVPYLSHSPKNDPQRDAKFTTQLLRFNKATLAYGLLKYRHRWSSRDDRIAVLTGDLRKVGLLPALAALLALFISAAAIFFKEDSNPLLFFVWDFVVVVVIFYMMALYGLVSRERPQQVIELLEFTIQHRGAMRCNAASSVYLKKCRHL